MSLNLTGKNVLIYKDRKTKVDLLQLKLEVQLHTIMDRVRFRSDEPIKDHLGIGKRDRDSMKDVPVDRVMTTRSNKSSENEF
jgi:hypothetical protein